MDPIRWLLRAKRWAQHPPSLRQVLLVLGVIAVCLVLVGIEALGLWPEGLAVHSLKTRP